MRNGLLAAVVVIVLSCAAGALRAAPVPVGGSTSFDTNSPAFVPPTGDLVDSETRTLDLNYTAPTGMTFGPSEDPTTSVKLTQEVRRDPGTGQLTFLYQLDELNPGKTGSEGAMATYTSFGNFSTDVTGSAKAGTLTVSRSADGGTILANGDSMGLGRPPTFAVATDATNFDKNGSLTLELTDEFVLMTPGSPDGTQGAATATATFGSIFEPAAEGPPPPPPTGIPLPPSFWGGLAVLASAAALTRLRVINFA
jgi:hypothetical protein